MRECDCLIHLPPQRFLTRRWYELVQKKLGKEIILEHNALTVKEKQREHSRGTVEANLREDALQKAKARSFCFACGKKSHWHRDPECPRDKKKGTVGPHTTHVVFYTEGDALDVIAQPLGQGLLGRTAFGSPNSICLSNPKNGHQTNRTVQ